MQNNFAYKSKNMIMDAGKVVLGTMQVERG
jgi:hypothetical protein